MDRCAVTSWLLLPSPLLGAAAWEPVADALVSGADTVTIADPGAATHPDDVLAAFTSAAASASGRDLVLVPHSNAGYFAPLVASRVAAVATVYVDAALPAPTGPTPLAPPGFDNFLTGLADEDGLLPPWTQWWGDKADLFPDTATRERVTAVEGVSPYPRPSRASSCRVRRKAEEGGGAKPPSTDDNAARRRQGGAQQAMGWGDTPLPRLPLSYFRETVSAPEGWESRPQAYLAFGDTYADEWARAEALGWPTRRLAGGHLHLLHDPVETARAVRDLLARLRAVAG